jgi:type I restriction enzyme S subunit
MSKNGYALPATWIRVSLGQVISYGETEKVEPDQISSETWVLELEDVEKQTSKLLAHKTFAERRSKSSKNRFTTGDVLYGKLRPYLNKVIFASKPGVCTTEILPLRESAAVHGKYLFYWLKHPIFLDYVQAVSYGVNMPRLGTQDGKAAPFVLAPSDEQKRIADKLDSVLGRVDACRERLDRIALILKRFRQSVLAIATSGRLTQDWRTDSAPSQAGIPTQWTFCRVKDAGKVQLGRQRSPKFHSGEHMRPYLRVANVFEDRLDFSDVMEMDFPAEDFERYQLHVGDILLNEGQSPELLGRPAMYRGEIPGACFTNTLIRFQAFEHVDSNYALYVFRNHMHSGRYRSEGTITTNIAHLGAGRFSNIEFPLPPLAEQKEIVRRVTTLFAFADRLESRLANTRATAERLTPALLAKAFRGELVPQDPSDEPASELLKRLAANREAMPKRSRGTK